MSLSHHWALFSHFCGFTCIINLGFPLLYLSKAYSSLWGQSPVALSSMRNSQTAATHGGSLSPELTGVISYTTSLTIHQLLITCHSHFYVVPLLLFNHHAHYLLQQVSVIFSTKTWGAGQHALEFFVLSISVNLPVLLSVHWLIDYKTVMCRKEVLIFLELVCSAHS